LVKRKNKAPIKNKILLKASKKAYKTLLAFDGLGVVKLKIRRRSTFFERVFLV